MSGKSAPHRQGAVSACTSGSEVAPMLMGGMYIASPSAVTDLDVTWALTDSYGRLLVVPTAYDGNSSGTLLASASRISSSNSGDLTNRGARGAVVWMDISATTAVSGSDNLTLAVEAKNPVSGCYHNMLVSASLTAVGAYMYVVYPTGASCMTTEEVTETVSLPLPRTWRVNIAADSGCSFTYSLGYEYLI